jgi:hypothetical protein
VDRDRGFGVGWGVRALSLILPLLLLGVFFLVSNREPAPTQLPAPVALQEAVALAAGDGFLWVSHDWVEPVATANGERESARREIFGLDATRAAEECLDPNCRACLIDLVYGREF